MIMSWEIRQGSDSRTEEDVGKPSFSFMGSKHVEVSLNLSFILGLLK